MDVFTGMTQGEFNAPPQPIIEQGMDLQDILRRVIKYLVEGFAVAVAAYVIPKKKMAISEVAIIGLTAAAIFALLDLFAPRISQAARHGAGFGIGASQVGFTL